jgi:hypothetical protein
MTFKSGRFGRVTIGSGTPTELPTISWNVNPSASIIPFRNTRTGRHTLREATFFDCTVEVVIDYDHDANPFATPPNLTAGATITNVFLYVNGGSGASPSGDKWDFPSMIVQGTPTECSVEGKMGVRVSLVPNGLFKYPGGYDPASNT